MKNSRLAGWVMLIMALSALSACGADDATRIERARQYDAEAEYSAASIELKNVLRSDPANVDARVLLGQVALKSGDAVTAAKELQRARELGADPNNYAVPLARAMLAQGQMEAALGLHPEDLDNPGDRADLKSVLGNAHLSMGNSQSAEQSFQSALEDQPEHADALVGLSQIYLKRGEIRTAQDALERVISKQNDSHAAHFVLGQLQMNNGQHPRAEEHFRSAISHSEDPVLMRERMTYYAGLIDALLAQKKSGEGRIAANQMLANTPEHPYALFQAARVDFETGEIDATIDKTQRVATAFPDYLPARLLLAAAAMSRDNFALAEIHLRSVLNAAPDNPAARRMLAQAQMKMGSPAEALGAIEPLLDGNSTNPELLAMAGAASLRSGDTEKGLDYLARGLEAGSEDPAVQRQVATSLIASGQIDEAIAMLEKMPESMHGEARDFMLVLARLRAGDTEGAREHATSMVEQQPDSPVAHRIMGGFHMAVGEHDLARVAFEKVLELDPTDGGTIANLARLDVLDGDMASAENRYTELLSQSPGNLAAMLGLSQLAEQAGDLGRAVKLLEDAMEANPAAVQPAMLLARYYLRTGNHNLALERAEQVRAAEPDNVNAINMAGRALLQADRESEAIGTFERALQYEPNHADTHFYMAQAQMKFRMNEAARRSLEKTIELDPTHVGARVALSRMDSALGNFSAALEWARELREEYPDRAEMHVLEGDIHILSGHYADAIDAYDRAEDIDSNETTILKRFQARQRAGMTGAPKVLEEWLQRHPDNIRIRVALAQAYQNNGLTDKAIAEYERALERAADNIVALNNLAWLYAEKGGAGNLQKGIEIAQQAHALQPDAGAVTDTYGWLLLKQGKIDQSIDVLRLAVEQAPDLPDIRYHLAVALDRSGESDEARDLLDAILSGDASFSSRDDARTLRDSL